MHQKALYNAVKTPKLLVLLGLVICLFTACYEKAATSITEITATSSGNSNFGDQLDKVSGNLTQLNNLYEMQLEGVSALSKAREEMSNGITNIVSNL